MQRFLFNLRIALEALLHNKLRTILTALGIIFGVASVITMLAIGRGTEQEILTQIKLVGSNNIIIKQKPKENNNQKKEDKQSGKKEKKEGSLGLCIADGEAIHSVIPNIINVSAEVDVEKFSLRKGIGARTHLVGVSIPYFSIYNIKLIEGKIFDEYQLQNATPVCVIGKGVQTKFFSSDAPIGRKIKCGNTWFTVVGILEDRNVTKSIATELGIRDNNMDIFIPITTHLLRVKNRSLITKHTFNQNNDDEETPTPEEDKGYNQIDKLIVQVDEAENLPAAAEVISAILKRRHTGVTDFEINIPQDQLRQQESTKKTFSYTLGFIAGISLLVGGIGIMNIMLVSVMERLKEIGIRLALGATKKDVVYQFLSEAILISVMGGIAGIIIGVATAKSISKLNNIFTIITPMSIIISFCVAVATGIIFGIAPARKAAMQDPIESLRHE
ncbi:MAG: ABC transporter permease [Bacteroidetes bacterium]|nr:ABC transporter permease [Bacteroidota bacterium]